MILPPNMYDKVQDFRDLITKEPKQGMETCQEALKTHAKNWLPKLEDLGTGFVAVVIYPMDSQDPKSELWYLPWTVLRDSELFKHKQSGAHPLDLDQDSLDQAAVTLDQKLSAPDENCSTSTTVVESRNWSGNQKVFYQWNDPSRDPRKSFYQYNGSNKPFYQYNTRSSFGPFYQYKGDPSRQRKAFYQ